MHPGQSPTCLAISFQRQEASIACCSSLAPSCLASACGSLCRDLRCWSPLFSPALPVTHELAFMPTSRTAHRTGNEAQLPPCSRPCPSPCRAAGTAHRTSFHQHLIEQCSTPESVRMVLVRHAAHGSLRAARKTRETRCQPKPKTTP